MGFFSNIVLTLIVSQAISLFIQILKFVSRFKLFAIKFLAIDIGAALIIMSWYFNYTSKSWDWTRDSNQWAVIYLLIWMVDQFIIEPYFVWIKVLLINASISNKSKIFSTIQIVLIQFEENLWFRGMENILEVNIEKNKLKLEQEQKEKEEKMKPADQFNW